MAMGDARVCRWWHCVETDPCTIAVNMWYTGVASMIAQFLHTNVQHGGAHYLTRITLAHSLTHATHAGDFLRVHGLSFVAADDRV